MTGKRPDDRTQLESLLRSLRDDVAFPPEPDVRAGVRKRLQDLSQFGAVSGARESIQGIETESQTISGPRSSTVGSGEGKSLRRQLLEMAAASVILVIFTGALVLLYRDLVSDEGAVPGTEDLTEDAATLEEVTTAIAFSRMVDGEAVLTFADVDGNVLHEIYGLPQHRWGAELYGIAAAVSPDGTSIAFEGSGTEQGNLYLKDLRGGDDEPLVVESDSYDSGPVWSPDGEWIAFERNVDGHPEIYIVRPDGSDLRQITETEDGAGLPVWSPEGERIAFLSPPSWEQLGYVPGSNPAEHTPFQIHIVNADGTDQREIPDGELAHPQDLVSTNDPNSAQAWSADGQRLAVTVYEEHEGRDGAWSRLAIVDVDDESIEVFRPEMSIQSPSWSPNGRSIAVWGQSEPDAGGLYLFDVEDEEWASITVEDDSITGTEWSPDGRYIKMGRFHDEGLDIYVFDTETGEQHLVAESTNPASLNALVRVSSELASSREATEPTPTIIPSGSGELPPPPHDVEDISTKDISVDIPDDQRLAIAVQRWIDDRRVMSVFGLDGELLWEFAQIPNIEVEDFSRTIIADVSPDGRHVAFQHEDENGASDIFVMDADGGEPRQLTTTGDNYRPVWSPGGESIAFLSGRAHDEETYEYQRAEIFVTERDGSNVRQLTYSPHGAGQMKWSHDGTMIAFASPGFHSAAHLIDDGDPPEFPYQLYVVDVESGQQRELRDATMEHLAGFGLTAQPWLSDNSGVLFERYGRVYLASADGSGVEELDAFPSGEEGHQRWATASPDGQHVAFNWTQDDDESPVGIMDLETGEATALIEELGTAWHGGWSPDGAYLSATKAGEQPDDLSFRDLWVVAPDDGSARHIAAGVTDHNVRWLIVPNSAPPSN